MYRDTTRMGSVVLAIALAVQVAGASLANGTSTGCPARCTCVSSSGTVRCVFQKLHRVPRLPSDTAVLDLRFNDIVELRAGDFRGLSRLHTLMLNDNHLRHLPASVFAGAPGLRYVYLYKNDLESIEPGAFADLPRLEQLFLHQNQLREILPGTFDDLPRLERLFLQNNRLERLPAEAFRNIGHNAKLRLDSNALICDCEILWLVERMKERVEMPAVCRGPREMEGKRLDDMTPEDFHCSRPVIMEGPEDMEVQLGETAIFRCRAGGDPQPSITWMRDSNEIPVEDERYQLAVDGSLVISQVTESDAGEYECVAHNGMGYTKSRAARTLIVSSSQAPRFVETPRSQTVHAGMDVVMVCRAVETQPSSRIEWWRDGARVHTRGRYQVEDAGSSLKILAAKEADSARYVCQARNSHGYAETSADLSVVGEEHHPPRLTYQPQDMEVELGAIVELACRAEGQPRPKVSWRKDGSALEGNRTRVSKHGSLYLYNVTERDVGRYECRAVNEHGRATASALVRVRRPDSNEGLVLRAFEEATREIDRAINNTLEQLFNPASRSSNPFHLSRFPDAVARRAARPAELFERTLLHVRRMVESGTFANATDDFTYEELLTHEQLVELEKLSGCTSHRHGEECLNLCYHNRYRTIDGKCNNLEHPTWGSSYTGFRRILRPIYENGFSQPVGWDRSRLYHGHTKPAARLVSTSLIVSEDITSDDRITHLVMQWGQWIDHDFDHALPAVSSESWGGIDCKKSCDNAAPCFPMEVPPGDPRIKNRRCIDFFRTSAVCGSGMTSILWGKLTPREQLNQLTSYLDASQVYGYDDNVARDLRDFTTDLGLLLEGPSFPGRKALLPFANGQFIDCRRNVSESSVNCFLAGDFRVNEQIGLTVVHTVWMREHNRIARKLHLINPHWRGEKLYQEARKIVGAQMQVITYRDWIPRVLGDTSDELFGAYRGYDKNVDASIANVFATAALRFGHSLIQPKLERLGEDMQPTPQGPLHLRDAFFAPWRLVDEGGTDPLLRGMFATPAKLKRPEQNLNSELTEQLFRTAHAVALDLASMNIQRGRDHALPSYVDWRRYCNMSEVETFDDLRGEISSLHVRNKLRELYGHPGNIDVWVGGILEDQVPDAKVGPLFKCLLREQFKRMRDGDRFWLENPVVFQPEQLRQIRKTSLARIICDNADNITRVQRDVFLLPDGDNSFVSCGEIPEIDLHPWSECCEECIEQADESNAISRSRRNAAKYSATANGHYGLKGREDEVRKKIKRVEEMLDSASEEYARVSRVLSDLSTRIEEMKHLLDEMKSVV
ncbi:peroxidasin homolog [Copidosoma floridanum]|uniref:peroxidasin homolog n=1 Tax=Copidosoma floridanum TaxID=29053 RepID=UPI0006C965BA|nr:peroxidasin homolog [Copidosoma floridanum]